MALPTDALPMSVPSLEFSSTARVIFALEILRLPVLRGKCGSIIELRSKKSYARIVELGSDRHVHASKKRKGYRTDQRYGRTRQ